MKLITIFLFCFPIFAQGNALQLCDQQSTKHCMTIKAPATLPANVICELGAADFGTCVRSNYSSNGTVTVYPPTVIGGPGVAVAPDGSLISCVGTTTACLQEAEDYRYAHGMNLYIVGGQAMVTAPTPPVPDGVTYTFSAGARWIIHPVQGGWTYTGSLTIACNVSGPCLDFDSQQMVDFEMHGSQVVNSGGGCYRWFPQNLITDETNPLIGIVTMVSSFRMGACVGGSGATLAEFRYDTYGGGGVGGNVFSFGEMNGGAVAIKI